MIMPLGLGHALTKNALYLVFAVAAVAPLVLAPARSPAGVYARAFAWRPVEWLGEISYEIYLVHLLAMALMIELTGYPQFHGSIVELFALTLAASIPLAWLLAKLTQPRGASGGRVQRSRRRASTAAPPAHPVPAEPSPGTPAPVGSAGPTEKASTAR